MTLSDHALSSRRHEVIQKGTDFRKRMALKGKRGVETELLGRKVAPLDHSRHDGRKKESCIPFAYDC